MLSSKIIKKITACCCMAAVMLAASGCSDSKSYVSNSNEPKELKITYVKSPLNIPSIIDKNLQTVSKEFAKTDTKISYPKSIPVPNKLKHWQLEVLISAVPSAALLLFWQLPTELI